MKSAIIMDQMLKMEIFGIAEDSALSAGNVPLRLVSSLAATDVNVKLLGLSISNTGDSELLKELNKALSIADALPFGRNSRGIN